MDSNKIFQGHTLEVLRTFSDESVNCVITSPPYWGLRDYGIEPVDWGDCKGSLGLEPTPELYIKHLLGIFDEIKRVLRKDGTCWVNIGDSYSGSWGNRSHKPETKHLNKFNVMPSDVAPPTANISNIPAKSLVGIPEMFVLGMRDRGWIRRNTIVWYKRNCMPSSAKDRFTVDFEYVYFFTKTGKYWFEQQFEPHQSIPNYNGGQRRGLISGDVETSGQEQRHSENINYGTQGRNKRCVWDIPTQSFSEAHFATFPEALVEPMIKAGCPEFICKKCGKAREKIYKAKFTDHNGKTDSQYNTKKENAGRLALLRQASREKGEEYHQEIEFLGFTDCNCNANFESGMVLDPFCGSGTTLRVAEKFNRRWIGIDLNPKYIEMAKEKRLKEVQKVLC